MQQKVVLTTRDWIVAWTVILLLAAGVVACSLVTEPMGASLAATQAAKSHQTSGSQTHTECYQSTAAAPGYNTTVLLHEEIVYDQHNNILSRQAGVGAC